MKDSLLILKTSISKETIFIFGKIITIITVFVVSLLIINKCHSWFYDSLVGKNLLLSINYIILYICLMFFGSICESELQYQKRIFSIKTRINLYNYYNTDVLDDQLCPLSCQRMSQDISQFGMQFIHLFSLLFQSILILPSFIIVLSNIINPMIVLGAVVYAFLLSILGRRIGKPVVQLQYTQESIEGHLRRDLITELHKKKDKILPSLTEVSANFIKFSKKERILMYIKNCSDRISHSIPYIVMMPYYFMGIITLGVMVQGGIALSKIITEMNFFVNNIDKIVEFKATTQRIMELNDIKIKIDSSK